MTNSWDDRTMSGFAINRCTIVLLKELCHGISVFLVTEAGWGSSFSNQACGRCGFVTSVWPASTSTILYSKRERAMHASASI